MSRSGTVIQQTQKMMFIKSLDESFNEILDKYTWELFTTMSHTVDRLMTAWKADYVCALFDLKNTARVYDSLDITQDFNHRVMVVWIERGGVCDRFYLHPIEDSSLLPKATEEEGVACFVIYFLREDGANGIKVEEVDWNNEDTEEFQLTGSPSDLREFAR